MKAGLVAVLCVTLLPVVIHADELKGTILGADGQPKRFVLVDVLGPTRVFTQADENGRFSVEVQSGLYTIRIRDGRRRAKTEVFVQGTTERDFRAEW